MRLPRVMHEPRWMERKSGRARKAGRKRSCGCWVCSRGCQLLQDGRGMAGNLQRTPFGAQDSLCVDKKRAAHDAKVALAVEHLLVDDVKGLAPGFIGVGDQRERKLLLGAEAGMRSNRVARNAENFAIQSAELAVQVAKITGFGRASRRRVTRVEIDHDPLSAKGREIQGCSGISRAAELRHLLADRDGFACAHAGVLAA